MIENYVLTVSRRWDTGNAENRCTFNGMKYWGEERENKRRAVCVWWANREGGKMISMTVGGKRDSFPSLRTGRNLKQNRAEYLAIKTQTGTLLEWLKSSFHNNYTKRVSWSQSWFSVNHMCSFVIHPHCEHHCHEWRNNLNACWQKVATQPKHFAPASICCFSKRTNLTKLKGCFVIMWALLLKTLTRF